MMGPPDDKVGGAVVTALVMVLAASLVLAEIACLIGLGIAIGCFVRLINGGAG